MRIAVSQRVDVVADYGERRDALDQAWYPLLASIGCVALPAPNSPDGIGAWLIAVKPEGILLSGGNDPAGTPGATGVAPERDDTERALLEYAREHSLPVLGVCRGAQFMNLYCGGSLCRVDGHVAKRHSLQVVSERLPALTGLTRVNSFHNAGIGPGQLAESLQLAATAEDGTIEAFVHRYLPWVGILWHPEREPAPYVPQDLALMKQLFRVNG